MKKFDLEVQSTYPDDVDSPIGDAPVTVRANQKPSRGLLMPLALLQLYLTFTVLAFALGPLDFTVQNPVKLYSFIFLTQLAIAFGYLVGIRRKPYLYRPVLSTRQVLKSSILAAVLVMSVSLYVRNYSGMSLTEAAFNPGEAYNARLDELRLRESTSTFSIVRTVFGPLLGIFLPAGIIFREQLSKPWRWLWCVGAVCFFADSLLAGAAKGLFDIVLVVPVLLWMRHKNPAATMGSSKRRGSVSVSRSLLWLFAIALLVISIVYFGFSRMERYSEFELPPDSVGWSKAYCGLELPDSLEFTIHSLMRYLTQGYYGLSGCLDLPFEWGGGVSHSNVLSRYLGTVVGDPTRFSDLSYPVRLEKYSSHLTAYNWHTIYPWLASDLTFPGAILFIGLMGYLLARAIRDSMLATNPFAIGFLLQLVLLFYYVPANNLRLSYSEELVTFWSLLLLWQLTSFRALR